MNSEALPSNRKGWKGPSKEDNPDDTHQFLQQYLDSLPPLQNPTKKKRKRKRKPSLTEEDIKKNLDAVNNSLSNLLPMAHHPTYDKCGVADDPGLLNEASNQTGVPPLKNRRNKRKRMASPTKEEIKKNLDALEYSLSDLIPAPHPPCPGNSGVEVGHRHVKEPTQKGKPPLKTTKKKHKRVPSLTKEDIKENLDALKDSLSDLLPDTRPLPPTSDEKQEQEPTLTEEDIKKNLDALNNSLSDLIPQPHPPSSNNCGVAVDLSHVEESTKQNEKELEKLLQELQNEGFQPESSQWTKRNERNDSIWIANRRNILEAIYTQMGGPAYAVCAYCDKEAVVECSDCMPCVMCCSCDLKHHQHRPFHSRWTSLSDDPGYLSPTTFLQELSDGYCTFQVKTMLPWSPMPQCAKCGLSDLVAKPWEPLSVITTKGRMDVWSTYFTCQSGINIYPTPLSYLRLHLWSGSPSKLNTLYEEPLFEIMDLVQKLSPGTSMSSFIHAIGEISTQRNRCHTINQSHFSKAMQEWKFMRSELAKKMYGDFMQCPCCETSQIAVHIDGNAKLYRYCNTVDERSSYYTNRFICPNQPVRDFVNTIRGNGSLPDKACGSTSWKAARNVPAGKRNLAETGLEIASCRHTIALKALNMERGEIFAYPCYLQQLFAQRTQFMCGDTICKYWPWYQKIVLDNPTLNSDMKPLLSVLHGKAHSWPCQIFWGAQWQNGAGLTTGENVEQVNSYLSRYTNTTKYMTAAGREETLTEGVLFWNKRKIDSLAQMLRTWYDKTLQREKQFLAEFEKLLDTYGQQDMDHITRELVAYAAEKLNRPDAARAQAITLEEKIELAVSAVAERKRILSLTGDTSKRRHKIRLKLDKDKAVLRKLLVDYNGLHPEAQCTEVDIAAEVYPWHDINGSNDISIVAKRKLGEAHLGISRAREELGHLLSEMRQYLEFYRARLAEAQSRVIFLESNEDNELLPSSEIDTRYVCGKLTKWTRNGALVLAKLNLKYQKRQLELGMEYLNLVHPREEDAEENEDINNKDISDSDISDSEL